jgi:hypothetical protein
MGRMGSQRQALYTGQSCGPSCPQSAINKQGGTAQPMCSTMAGRERNKQWWAQIMAVLIWGSSSDG